MKEWDAARDAEDEDFEENDPEKPNLEEMMAAQKEKITAQREADEAFLEEFGTALKEKNVPVLDDIKTDNSAEFVFVKLMQKLRDHFELRENLLEREQALALSSKELPLYETSFTYKQSKFGLNSPLSLSNPIKTREHAVLYRERIYYLSSPEEQAQFLKQPSKYTNDLESIPLDVPFKPSASVIGLPRSGKSTLCERISQHTGAIHLRPEDVIQEYIDSDSALCEKLRGIMKAEGRGIDDNTLIQLIKKRV